jgi:hypothetical protein
MRNPPALTPDLRQWAEQLRRWLALGNSQLEYKQGTVPATQNGVILWDASGYPVVSRSNVFERVAFLVAAPASAAAAGNAGDIAVDANYIYVCTATDTWKRAAISTW